MNAHKPSSLKGYLLLGAPHVDHSPFQKSVIFLFAHDNNGAMGICINQAFDQTSLVELDETPTMQTGISQPVTILEGGPIENDRGFIIHTAEYQHTNSFNVHDSFFVTNTTHFMPKENEEPKNIIFALGYTAWQKNSLEQEIQQNLWMLCPATHELVFNATLSQKWILSLLKIGITDPFLTSQAGHA